MRTVEMHLGERTYPIYIGHGMLDQFGAYYTRLGLGRKAALISSRSVADLYLEAVLSSLRRAGYEAIPIVIPDGEEQKSLATADRIYEHLILEKLDRSSAIIALGGGVVGDLAGFVAATFLRGVDFVQIPTTILAQVDSSMGGKAAVDHRLGKNLIGAFHQPKLVFMDTEILRTLPRREVAAGMAEIIKHGMIRDEALFGLLEEQIESFLEMRALPEALDELIERNARIKGHFVELDERETVGARMLLNYGHTIGHAIEALAEYKRYNHGEAVILGMIAAGKIAVDVGLFDEADLKRQNDLLERVGIPEWTDALSVEAILEKLTSDKKVREGRVRFVLPKRIGEMMVTDQVEEHEVRRAVAYLRTLSKQK